MRSWKLALALALVVGVGIWAVGLRGGGHGHGQGPAQAARPAPSASPLPDFARLSQQDSARGALTPSGKPEFSATFTSGTLDPRLWATCFPWMDQPGGCTDYGNGEEHEWYLPGQVSVSGRDLVLTARQTPTTGLNRNGDPSQYKCRSGMVTSYPGLKFEYGYVQIRAWIPAGPGLWPALWLAAANQHWPPEIDLFESAGLAASSAGTAQPRTAQTGTYLHADAESDDVARRLGPVAQGWHTVALSWTKSQLTWFLDGKEIMIAHQGIPHQPMYLIADLAESGIPKTPAYCNGSMKIRSVKVWRS